MNPYDEREVHDALFQACVLAVSEGFPQLTVRDIIEPQLGVWDAIIARQIVFHLMVGQFGLAKRRLVKMQGRDRKFLDRAIATIDQRLQAPAFEAHYRTMAARAHALVEARNEEAA